MRSMKRLAVPFCLVLLAGCGGAEADRGRSAAVPPPPAVNTRDSAQATGDGESVLRYEMRRLDGTREDLSKYRGRVVLIVNTATECGYTPQLEGLQELYDSRRRDGLVVLGFPANDFGGQEPRSNAEIAEFCEANYGVRFPMFGKTVVTGDDATPLFTELGEPDWNFNKYLLDRRGRLQQRWGASTAPDDAELVRRVDDLLSS
jgi:glutathione peroxidase